MSAFNKFVPLTNLLIWFRQQLLSIIPFQHIAIFTLMTFTKYRLFVNGGGGGGCNTCDHDEIDLYFVNTTVSGCAAEDTQITLTCIAGHKIYNSSITSNTATSICSCDSYGCRWNPRKIVCVPIAVFKAISLTTCPLSWQSASDFPNICYFFSHRGYSTDWNSASQLCNSYGANLPVFFSKLEYYSYSLLLKTNGFCYSPIWLGYSFYNNSSISVVNSTLTEPYTSWQTDPKYNQTVMCGTHFAFDGWMQEYCNDTQYFACQLRLNPPIVTPNTSNGNCSKDWLADSGGFCYYVPNQHKTWSEALNYCESMNATLPVFCNKKELDNFRILALSSLPTCRTSWAGFNDSSGTGSFFWINRNVSVDLSMGLPGELSCIFSPSVGVVAFNYNLTYFFNSNATSGGSRIFYCQLRNGASCIPDNSPQVYGLCPTTTTSTRQSTKITTTSLLPTSIQVTNGSNNDKTSYSAINYNQVVTTTNASTPNLLTSFGESSSSESSTSIANDVTTYPIFNSTTDGIKLSSNQNQMSTLQTSTLGTSLGDLSLSSKKSSTANDIATIKTATNDLKIYDSTRIVSKKLLDSQTSPTMEIESQPVHQTTIDHAHVFNTTERIKEVCTFGQWSNFSECSASCGESFVRKRQKSVIQRGIYCPDQIEIENCNLPPCNPMSPKLQAAAKAIQALGCSWMIGVLTASFVFSILFWSRNTNRILHASQELSLLLAHCIIALARSETKNKIICTLAGIGLQYFFLVNFLCLLLEAVHVFAVVTSIVSEGSFYTMQANVVIGWVVPGFIVAITAVFSHNHYISKFSCWLNFGHSILSATFIPVMICCCSILILLETTGQFHVKNTAISCPKDMTTAKLSQRSLLFIMPLSFFAWLIGSYAIFEQNFGLFTTVLGLNLTLGISILIFHVFGNEQGRKLFQKVVQKICHRN